MNKTPDETKAGLKAAMEELLWSIDKGCSDDMVDSMENAHARMSDALITIQQLEDNNAKKHEKIMQLYIALEDMQGIVQSITQDSKTTFQQLETENHQLLTKVNQLEKSVTKPRRKLLLV